MNLLHISSWEKLICIVQKNLANYLEKIFIKYCLLFKHSSIGIDCKPQIKQIISEVRFYY